MILPMFRFTIRELVLVTVIVGLAISWLRETRSSAHLARENASMRRQLDYVDSAIRRSRLATAWLDTNPPLLSEIGPRAGYGAERAQEQLRAIRESGVPRD